MNLRELLERKERRDIVTVEPQMDIRGAMKILVKNKIGALLVCGGDNKLAGIITERDILWRLYQDGEDTMSKKVEDLMTKKVIVGILDDSVETAETFMTTNRFRHLPVMEGDKVVGLISIGDIVKSRLGDLKVENRYLTDYIVGKYPA